MACAGGQQSWECRGVAVQLGCGCPETLLKCWCLKEYQVCDGSQSFHQLLHWQLKKRSVWEWGRLCPGKAEKWGPFKWGTPALPSGQAGKPSAPPGSSHREMLTQVQGEQEKQSCREITAASKGSEMPGQQAILHLALCPALPCLLAGLQWLSAAPFGAVVTERRVTLSTWS